MTTNQSRYDRHLVVVRCHYEDPVLSATRLELSERTIVPSLCNQKVPFDLVLRVNPHDPLLDARLDLFARAGVPLQLETEADCDRCLWSRIDDDDAVADDYLEQVQSWTNKGKDYVGFSRGMVWQNNRFLKAHIRGNMFANCLSTDPSWNIFQENHRALLNRRRDRAILLPDTSAWIWVRHPTTKTGCLRKYLNGFAEFPEHRYSNVVL